MRITSNSIKVGPRLIHTYVCAHCGRTDVGTFKGGYATLVDPAYGSQRQYLCRPNVADRPNCYRLVSQENHKLYCKRKGCRYVEETPEASRPTEAVQKRRRAA